jgi:hypothetical protein
VNRLGAKLSHVRSIVLYFASKDVPAFNDFYHLSARSFYLMLYHTMSHHLMSCHVMLCYVTSCSVMSCYVRLCHIMLCHVMSCHVMVSGIVIHIICHALSEVLQGGWSGLMVMKK